MRFVLAFLLLSACSGAGIASAVIGAATGGGPSVDAQVGKENAQGVSQRGSGTQAVVAVAAPNQTAETVNNFNEAPLWVWLLALIGWILPSPNEIGRTVTGWFKR